MPLSKVIIFGTHFIRFHSSFSLSETPVEYRISPPLLGQYNEEIYQGLLGKSAEELQKLKAAGIV